MSEIFSFHNIPFLIFYHFREQSAKGKKTRFNSVNSGNQTLIKTHLLSDKSVSRSTGELRILILTGNLDTYICTG